jgi:hypothetical protein
MSVSALFKLFGAVRPSASGTTQREEVEEDRVGQRRAVGPRDGAVGAMFRLAPPGFDSVWLLS